MSGAARFAGRWRVALRYGSRDARRNKGRTALVAVMVALPVLVGTLATTTLWTATGTPASLVRSELGPHLQAGIDYAGPGFEQSPDGVEGSQEGDVQQTTVQAAELEAEARAVLPVGATLVRAGTSTLAVVAGDLQVSGRALQADLDFPGSADAFPLAAGTLPGDGEVALARSLARQLRVGMGDAVTLEPPTADAFAERTATVSGLLTSTQTRGTQVLLPVSGPLDPPAEFSSSDPSAGGSRWFVAGAQPVSWADVLELNELGLKVVSRAVVLDPPRPASASSALRPARSSWSALCSVSSRASRSGRPSC